MITTNKMQQQQQIGIEIIMEKQTVYVCKLHTENESCQITGGGEGTENHCLSQNWSKYRN